jgi:acylphosphatase
MTQVRPVRLDATVRGRVQGVGFRYHVLRAAAMAGLDGSVRNEPDGAVRCVAEGGRADLEALLRTIEAGPPGAVVTGVEVVWSDASGDLGPFTIGSRGHPGD